MSKKPSLTLKYDTNQSVKVKKFGHVLYSAEGSGQLFFTLIVHHL